MLAKIAKLLLVAGIFTQSSAWAHPYLNDAMMKKIDLMDYQLIDIKENANTSFYKMKPLQQPTAKLIKSLENESYSLVVSPILELNQKSSFQNIYVYIGKKNDGTYEFCTVYINHNGNPFVVDMDIDQATKTELHMRHGPTDDITEYKLITGRDLFP